MATRSGNMNDCLATELNKNSMSYLQIAWQIEQFGLDNTDFLARWRGHMVVKYVEGALREIAGLDPKVKQPPHGL